MMTAFLSAMSLAPFVEGAAEPRPPPRHGGDAGLPSRSTHVSGRYSSAADEDDRVVEVAVRTVRRRGLAGADARREGLPVVGVECECGELLLGRGEMRRARGGAACVLVGVAGLVIRPGRRCRMRGQQQVSSRGDELCGCLKDALTVESHR